MNLSEALDAALPEIPRSRLARNRRPPRLDPDLIIREEVLDGVATVGVLQRHKANFFRLSPEQWELAKLFDGARSYEEIADLSAGAAGASVDVDEVRSFAESLDEADLWYRTPQEKNLALNEKLAATRERRGRSKIDLAHIGFSAWDPDRYFEILDKLIGKYIYSRWFTLAVVALFAFETWIFISDWSLLGPDTVLFYNFAHKNLADFAQIWILLFIVGFFHESAHGLTCKHYGGQVHSMGFMFIYLTPAFYVDVTEIWIYADKMQRLATIIAGIWLELAFCGVAMIVWTNTRTGEWIHDFAYQIILLTGFLVALINLNPLIKLDGYYFLTTLIEIPDLKENSTAFLSGWFQSRVLRLPVDVPVVPQKRALLFIVYASLSGLYSYTLLFFVVRFAYNIAHNWLAEFALIPAGLLAFAIFRSRLRALRKVTVQVWEQRKSQRPRWRHLSAVTVLAALLLLPIWRDRFDAYYVVEPSHSRTVHAAIDGSINQVLVREGEKVSLGQPLLRMSSLTAASMHSYADAQKSDTSFSAFDAQVHGQSIGAAAAAQHGAAQFTGLASEAQSALVVSAPADGTVLTRDPAQLLDEAVGSGQPLLELGDSGPRVARVYIPASALDRLPANAEVAFAIPGRFSILRMALPAPAGDAVVLPAGLVAHQDFKGVQLAVYYNSRVILPARIDLAFGVGGPARIFGVRRSIAERALLAATNLVKTHVW